ncbi:hypothetical protein A1O1_07964 [Capronia coronata CBS 617.96]|uniref:FHA domain-containing protein n=1 Tax=Capronia coronata CBS 617.96 TaxID=1182541 RepID=W9XNX7_9EURO|nr:uncharacterized protein A1O1_07964 [Capronia coronata CBS 617.96]EXJ81898.1 hypothetical protein A1O1_07964 [Capronia coronata CBS 617.96]
MSKNSQPSSPAASISGDVDDGISDLPCVLARHSSRDCYFDIKITHVERTTFGGSPAYQLRFKLDFARPFDVSKRIRSAAVDINLASIRVDRRQGPTVVGLTPEANLVCVAEHEVNSGQNVGVTIGAPGPAAGAISINAGRSWGDKTTFQGSRLFHGFLLGPDRARWKMYEEPKSQSGLPPSLELMVMVTTGSSFYVNASVRIQRWRGWGVFGAVHNVDASEVDGATARSYLVLRNRVLDGSSAALKKASDNITKILKEREENVQMLEDLANEHFPELNFDAVYGPSLAILKLHPLNAVNGLFDWKQINVPFQPHRLVLARQTGEARADNKNGIFDASAVSRRHAEVWANEDTGQVYIRDLGSRGGTFINGHHLSKGTAYMLHKGDQLQLGSDVVENGEQTIEYHKLLANVDFVGLWSHATTEDSLDSTLLDPWEIKMTAKLHTRKEHTLKVVNDKFDSWRIGDRNEELEGMLQVLQDVVDRRIETLALAHLVEDGRDVQLVVRREIERRASVDPVEDRESVRIERNRRVETLALDDPLEGGESEAENEEGSREGSGAEEEQDTSEADSSTISSRRSRRPSEARFPRAVYTTDSVFDDRYRYRPSRQRPGRYYDMDDDHYRYRPSRERPSGYSNKRGPEETSRTDTLIPRIQTGEEALANHRSVGRGWTEVKL